MQTALIAAEVATTDQDERRRRRSAKLQKWRARREFQKLLKLPCLPEREVVYGALFYNTLYFIAKRHGYADNPHKALHILTFRRFLLRFYHIVEDGEDHHLVDENEVNKRMQQLPTWIGWEDLHKALDPEITEDVLDIKVRRNRFELVAAVLEANDSILGYVWSTIITGCILTSLAVIVLGDSWFPEGTNGVCIIMFTVEYIVRLLCAPFCRRSLVETARIYKDIVPESGDDVSYMSGASTKTTRLLNFAVAPMNFVDLVSILPWWINHAFATSGIKLGFLRSLRLIRLVRLMKVGGLGRKFEIMCEVFARSWGSILAITITLCVLSLMFGALMAQLEDDRIEEDLDNAIWSDNDEWVTMVDNGNDVPLAMLWVAGRLTGMQSNMGFKKHATAIPANWFNQVVVHILGIMKGFVFLLPLGQLKKISKEEDQRWQEIDELEYDVATSRKVKAGEEWTHHMTASYATVEVFEMGEHEEVPTEETRDQLEYDASLRTWWRSTWREDASSAHRGRGFLNLPIGKGKWDGAVTTVSHCPITGLLGSDLLAQTGSTDSTPVIFFEVAWAPIEGSAGAKGTLTLTPIEAQGFPAPAARRRWKLRIRLHEKLFGAAAQKWACLHEADEGSDESVQFSIDWSGEQYQDHAGAEKGGEDLGVLRERLAGQIATLGAIEEASEKKGAGGRRKSA
jgi:hypothetical protein